MQTAAKRLRRWTARCLDAARKVARLLCHFSHNGAPMPLQASAKSRPKLGNGGTCCARTDIPSQSLIGSFLKSSKLKLPHHLHSPDFLTWDHGRESVSVVPPHPATPAKRRRAHGSGRVSTPGVPHRSVSPASHTRRTPPHPVSDAPPPAN
jgi:hypothetical protein